MTTEAKKAGTIAPPGPSRLVALFKKEDWWAIWLGVGLVIAAILFFKTGSSIKWIAVTPQKWSHGADLIQQLTANAPRYLALLVLWAALFGLSLKTLGIRLTRFLPAFVFLFIVSTVIFAIGQWDQAVKYNLEPPLVALLLGLVISNTVGLPKWMDAGFRVEYYIKTGIVLLGATLPLTLILWAGPVAILQAAIVSITTFSVIFLIGKKLGLDRRLAATLGAGGAVCGVSGAIAIAGAVGAKKEHAPIAISIVIFWAIAMIFALPLVSRSLHLPSGIAGAWIGTSEFADAAGFAAAQAYDGYVGKVAGITGAPEAAVKAFTLMKVIGRDVWIGIWAFILSIVATTRWETTGVSRKPDAREIWSRFPKFVVGFVITSALITVISSAYSLADYNKLLKPELVVPITALRTWAFIFCFFSIGLTTRFRELASAGARPFWAFTGGVVVNVILGFFLSTVVFAGYWGHLGG